MAAKVLSTETAFRAASQAVQILGGFGLSKDFRIEKIFRDARAAMIEDGVNETLAWLRPEDYNAKEVQMADSKHTAVQTPPGNLDIDTSGSPVGVVRMDTAKSYADIGQLLQRYLNQADEQAWQTIRTKIDYTYDNLDLALTPLEAETGFSRELKSRMEKGQKLLFKPNLVSPFNIDPQTHGPGRGSTACTTWPFVAALMRWFHDRLNVNYHAMSLGEAATMVPAAASLFTIMNEGRPISPEAVIEGKAGDFYGGWGFYFVRRYLAQAHDPSHRDDPMKGHEESVRGTFVPPGMCPDKLMVYDLNRIADDPSKGRVVKVPQGVNFQRIALHKAVVGGDPSDPEDLKAYPGSILINVPKLKVHMITLLSNAIKNLGIGLYPMQSVADSEAECRWTYSLPWHPVPGMKAGIPHSVWVLESDPATGEPRKDDSGNYAVKKTGGILATMADVIQAVRSQGIYMLHIVDAIEAINLDHTGQLPGIKEPEGLVIAGLDPVAVDLLCARYLFADTPLDEAEKAGLKDGNGGLFAQRVPVPKLEANQIVTTAGYDCPLSRDECFRYAEKRGLGRRMYHAVGKDRLTDCDIVSLRGHLGSLRDGAFQDLVTKTLYYDAYKMPWDLQLTTFSYLEAVDRLTSSSLKKDFLEAFDENGDSVVDYEEFGQNGLMSHLLIIGGLSDSRIGRERLGVHQGFFGSTATLLKLSDPMWNSEGLAPFQRFAYGSAVLVAYNMSLVEAEWPDPFLGGLTWGKGKWPSYQLAAYAGVGLMIYGPEFPNKIDVRSLYGHAFRYADFTQNGARYTGTVLFEPALDGPQRYTTDVLSGQAKPLDFVLYVPAGYGSLGGAKVPNVEETSLADKVFTAAFQGGQEVWNCDSNRWSRP